MRRAASAASARLTPAGRYDQLALRRFESAEGQLGELIRRRDDADARASPARARSRMEETTRRPKGRRCSAQDGAANCRPRMETYLCHAVPECFERLAQREAATKAGCGRLCQPVSAPIGAARTARARRTVRGEDSASAPGSESRRGCSASGPAETLDP